jgi:hypothetical protein
MTLFSQLTLNLPRLSYVTICAAQLFVVECSAKFCLFVFRVSLELFLARFCILHNFI